MVEDKYNLLGKEVQIKNTGRRYNGALNGLKGRVSRTCDNATNTCVYGISIEGIPNQSSAYGVYWLNREEFSTIEEGVETVDRDTTIGELRANMEYSLYAAGCGGNGGAGGSDTYDPRYDGISGYKDNTNTLVKKGDDMFDIVSIAKDRDIAYIREMHAGDRLDLYKRDPIVIAVEVKRRDEAGEGAADLLPLDLAQMQRLATDETRRKICDIDDHKRSIMMETDARYKDLEAILELPEIDVLDVLVKAHILSGDHANILPASMRLRW